MCPSKFVLESRDLRAWAQALHLSSPGAPLVRRLNHNDDVVVSTVLAFDTFKGLRTSVCSSFMMTSGHRNAAANQPHVIGYFNVARRHDRSSNDPVEHDPAIDV